MAAQVKTEQCITGRASIDELFAYLEFLARTELGPASDLKPGDVTFTLPEIKAACRDMECGNELYLEFQQEISMIREGDDTDAEH